MDYSEQYQARKELIEQMKKEMLGPGSEPNTVDLDHEIISTNPETRYCLGILYPQENKMNMEDDESVGIESDEKEELKLEFGKDFSDKDIDKAQKQFNNYDNGDPSVTRKINKNKRDIDRDRDQDKDVVIEKSFNYDYYEHER